MLSFGGYDGCDGDGGSNHVTSSASGTVYRSFTSWMRNWIQFSTMAVMRSFPRCLNFLVVCWVYPVWCSEATAGVMTCSWLHPRILTSLYFVCNRSSIESEIVQVITELRYERWGDLTRQTTVLRAFRGSENYIGGISELLLVSHLQMNQEFELIVLGTCYIVTLTTLSRLVKIMPFCSNSASAVQVRSRIGWLLRNLHCVRKNMRVFCSSRSRNSSPCFVVIFQLPSPVI